MPCAVLSTGEAAAGGTESLGSCPSRGGNESAGAGVWGWQGLVLYERRSGSKGGMFRFLKKVATAVSLPRAFGCLRQSLQSPDNSRSGDLPLHHKRCLLSEELSFGEHTRG